MGLEPRGACSEPDAMDLRPVAIGILAMAAPSTALAAGGHHGAKHGRDMEDVSFHS